MQFVEIQFRTIEYLNSLDLVECLEKKNKINLLLQEEKDLKIKAAYLEMAYVLNNRIKVLEQHLPQS